MLCVGIVVANLIITYVTREKAWLAVGLFVLNRASIVIRGRFNPPIFHPEWFDRFKVLPIQEIEWAKSERPKIEEFTGPRGQKAIVEEYPTITVTPDLSLLHFPSCTVKVTPDRFECLTEQFEKFSTVKEVSHKICDLLGHTPVTVFGINFHGSLSFQGNRDELLKGLFVNDAKRFDQIFGPHYQIGGTIKYIKKECTVSITIHPLKKDDNIIAFDANFQRTIEEGRADGVPPLLVNNFKEDREETVHVINSLVKEK